MAGQFLIGERLGDISRRSTRLPPVSPSQLLDAFHGALSWLIVRVFFGVIGRNIPNITFRKNCSTAHAFLNHYIEIALKPGNNLNYKRDGKERSISLGMAGILANRSNDCEQIRSQLLQCIMAMQETTSTLCSNTMFLLARHSDIWKDLRKEVIGLDLDSATVEDLKRLTLVQNILKKVSPTDRMINRAGHVFLHCTGLRIYPIFATSGRTSLKDTTLPRGGGPDGLSPVFVPKNSRIITLFYGLHRDKSIFGYDVEVFRPDRWNSISPSSWQYLPFSNGPRRCPGQDKAITEAAYLIIRFAQKFEVIESRDQRD